MRKWLAVSAVVLATAPVCVGVIASQAQSTPVVKWQAPGVGWGVPAVDDRNVYFLSRDHRLLAFDARTGAPLWSCLLTAEIRRPQGNRVLIAGAMVIAGDYDVVAVNRETGRIAWRFRPATGYGAGLYLGDVAGSLVFAGSPAGRLYAIDIATGNARWEMQVGNETTTVFDPIVSDGLVIAGFTTFGKVASGGVIAVEAVAGRAHWSTGYEKLGSLRGWAGGPVTFKHLVFSASSDGRVHALQLKDGRHVWSTESTAFTPKALDFRALAVHREELLAGSLSAPLQAFDALTGRVRWRAQGPLTTSTQRITIGDTLVYVVSGGALVAFDLESGVQRWRVADPKGRYYWPPATGNGLLFASANMGFRAFTH